MISVDPYLNATTRHADVILPASLRPREVALRPRLHGAVGAQCRQLLAARVRARAGLTVRVRDPRATRRDRRGARRRCRSGRIRERHDRRRGSRRRSPTRSPRSTAAIQTRSCAPSATARCEERLLDLLLRTGHRGDAFGAKPDGISLALLEAHPHGIDFGPLEPRLPDALATESGKVELAPRPLIDDLARLDAALAVTAAGGMVLVGRRQLRTANSWTQNVQVLVRGKDSCVAQLTQTTRAGWGSRTDPPPGLALRPAPSTFRSRSPTSSCPASSASPTAGVTACRARGRRSPPATQGSTSTSSPTRPSSIRSRATPSSTASRSRSHRRSARRRDYSASLVRYTAAKPGIRRGTGAGNSMIERVNVIGSGRVGSAVSARLLERGLTLDERRPGARAALRSRPRDRRTRRRPFAPGPGSRTSAARRRSRRSHHTRAASASIRCRRSRAGAGRAARRRLRGGDGRDRRGRHVATWLAETLGLRPFPLADENRAVYHAGAAIASNYLVTLRHAAGSLLEAAGAPPEALDPLMRRTIENDFELTGPIQRGDWGRSTAPRGDPPARPDSSRSTGCWPTPRWPSHEDLPDDRRRSPRARAAPCGTDRPRSDDGRASRGPPVPLRGGARGVLDRRDEPLRQPDPVRRPD